MIGQGAQSFLRIEVKITATHTMLQAYLMSHQSMRQPSGEEHRFQSRPILEGDVRYTMDIAFLATLRDAKGWLFQMTSYHTLEIKTG